MWGSHLLRSLLWVSCYFFCEIPSSSVSFFADLLNCSRVRFLRGFLLSLGIEGHEKNNPTSFLSFTLFVIFLWTCINYSKMGEALNLLKGKANFSMT